MKVSAPSWQSPPSCLLKLVVFDFDGTLADMQTIDELAKEYNVYDDLREIVTRARAGEIDIHESMTKGVRLLKGMKWESVLKVVNNITYMPNAREYIDHARKQRPNAGFFVRVKIVCFSGGFDIALQKAKKDLNLDAVFSNRLHVKDNVLTGEVSGTMMTDSSKGELLIELQDLMGITAENILTVGDGVNDISMFKESGVSVAFCASNKKVNDAATFIVDEKNLMSDDLTEVIPFNFL